MSTLAVEQRLPRITQKLPADNAIDGDVIVARSVPRHHDVIVHTT